MVRDCLRSTFGIRLAYLRLLPTSAASFRTQLHLEFGFFESLSFKIVMISSDLTCYVCTVQQWRHTDQSWKSCRLWHVYYDGNACNDRGILYTKWHLKIHPLLWFLFRVTTANIFWVISVYFRPFFYLLLCIIDKVS